VKCFSLWDHATIHWGQNITKVCISVAEGLTKYAKPSAIGKLGVINTKSNLN
jgi:hypothetical protein